jgi:hypothetical protein
MKNIIYSLLIAFGTLSLASCGLGSSPKKAANNFLTAFNDRDFDQARKYATPETNKLVDLMENLTNMAQSTDTIKPGKITVLEERIEGEVAYVTFKEGDSDETQELKLKKIDGNWLVHITKEDIAAKDANHPGGLDEEGYWSDEDSLENPQDSIIQ